MAATFYTFYTGNTLIIGWREHQKLISGQDGDIMEATEFTAYAIGVSDALNGIAFEIPKRATRDQVCVVVGRYLDAHPESWTSRGSDIVVAALKAAFPKK
jgi:hypothetical protein